MFPPTYVCWSVFTICFLFELIGIVNVRISGFFSKILLCDCDMDVINKWVRISLILDTSVGRGVP